MCLEAEAEQAWLQLKGSNLNPALCTRHGAQRRVLPSLTKSYPRSILRVPISTEAGTFASKTRYYQPQLATRQATHLWQHLHQEQTFVDGYLSTMPLQSGQFHISCTFENVLVVTGFVCDERRLATTLCVLPCCVYSVIVLAVCRGRFQQWRQVSRLPLHLGFKDKRIFCYFWRHLSQLDSWQYKICSAQQGIAHHCTTTQSVRHWSMHYFTKCW